MNKENDYFLNLIKNPDFAPGDFQAAGLNASNTSIANIDAYKDLKVVKENPMFLDDSGNFSEAKFNKVYDSALLGYNQLQSNQQLERVATSIDFYKGDIFAPLDAKRRDSFVIKEAINPNHNMIGFAGLNQISENPKSEFELAQSNQYFDPITGKWSKKTTEGANWFSNIWDPKVFATWDSDGTHVDPISGETVEHRKGEAQLDANGDYYYRTLADGEDVYGKTVLSNWDVLTAEDSGLNKFDFFDSDGKHKSAIGSIAREAVNILPMFIPYVGSAYIGLRVGLGMTDIATKLAKMTFGDDINFLNKMEGAVKSTDFGTSTDTKGSLQQGIEANPWSFESIVRLAGQTFTQLAEQRALFKAVAGAKAGRMDIIGETKAAQAARDAAKKSMSKSLYDESLQAIDPKKLTNPETVQLLKLAADKKAALAIDKVVGDAYKFGGDMSKLYMTGLTIKDGYEEAKQSGLDRLEAAMFMVGYGAGEWAILNTGLGDYILPELRMQRAAHKRMMKTLVGDLGEEIKGQVGTAVSRSSDKWYKGLMEKGRQLATADYSDNVLVSTTKNMLANGLGEGVEEVSEEALFDVSKVLSNYLMGKDKFHTIKDESGGDISNRYALNFLGGMLGGAGTVALPGFKEARAALVNPMTQEEALHRFVQIASDKEASAELEKVIDKMTFADKDLSAINFKNLEGTDIHLPITGSETDNQDKHIKDNLKKTLRYVQNIINTEATTIEQDSLLDQIKDIDKDLKIGVLAESKLLPAFMSGYNKELVNLVKATAELDTLKGQFRDGASIDQDTQDKMDEVRKRIQESRDEIAKYKDGTRVKEFQDFALFEVNQNISSPYTTTSFVQFVEEMENKPFSDVPENKIDYLQRRWANVAPTEKAAQMLKAYSIFKEVNKRVNKTISEFGANQRLGSDLGIDQSESSKFLQNSQENVINLAENQGRPGEASTLAEWYDQYIERSNPLVSKYVNLLSLLLGDTGVSVNMDTGSDYVNKIYSDSSTSLGQKLDLINDLISAMKSQEAFTQYIEDKPELQKEIEDLTSLKSIGKEEATQAVMEDIGKAKFGLTEASLKELLVANKDVVTQNFGKKWVLNEQTREAYKELFGMLSSEPGGDYEESAPDNISKLNDAIKPLQDHLGKTTVTDIEKLIDKFALAGLGKRFNISELLKRLRGDSSSAIKRNAFGDYVISESDQKAIKDALRLLDIIQAHIVAATDVKTPSDSIFDINFSYNGLSNKLLGTNYEVLNRSQGEILVADLAKIRSQLVYQMTLFNINSEAKLESHKRAELPFAFQMLKNIKVNFIGVDDNDPIMNDLDGIGEFVNAIQNAKNLSNLDINKLSDLNDAELEQMTAEWIAIQKAVFELFQKKGNLDKLFSHLKDPSRGFDLIAKEDTLYTSKTGDISNRSFLFWLASTSAVNPEHILADYKEVMSDTSYAATPAQREAVKNAYAFFANRPHIDKFVKFYNDLVRAQSEVLKDPKVDEFITKTLIPINNQKGAHDSTNMLLVQYKNIFLQEGNAGTGKSSGFYTFLLKTLHKFHPNVTGSIDIVHISKADAERLAKQISAETGIPLSQFNTFGKVEYLQSLSEDYTNPPTNALGQMELNDSIIDQATSRWKNVSLRKDRSKPTLTIIDEVTRFSQPDLYLVDDYMSQIGGSVISTGDYNQSSSEGFIGKDFSVRSYTTNFFGGPKLGASLRSESQILEYNASNLLKDKSKIIKDIVLSNPGSKTLHYAQNREGIFGNKLVGPSSGDTVEADIQLMLDTLDEGETVTYMYTPDEDGKKSELYNYISKLKADPRYSNKINMVSGADAQGKESTYYIVDLNSKGFTSSGGGSFSDFKAAESIVDLIYTALTRSKRGSLILKTGLVSHIYSNSKIETNPKSLINSAEAVDRMTKAQKKILDTAVMEASGQVKIVGVPKPGKDGKKTGATSTGDSTGASADVTVDTDDDSKPAPIGPADGSDNSATLAGQMRPPQKKPDTTFTGKRFGSKTYAPISFTFTVNETGLIWNGDKDNPEYSIDPKYLSEKGRIDTVYGLIRMAELPGFDVNSSLAKILRFLAEGKSIDKSQFDIIAEKLNELKHIFLLNAPSEIPGAIKASLGIGSGVNLTSNVILIKKLGPGNGKYSKGKKTDKNPATEVLTDGESFVGQDKVISGLISIQGADNGIIATFEIPIASIGNPLTVIGTNEFGSTYPNFANKWNSWSDKSVSGLSDFIEHYSSAAGVEAEALAMVKTHLRVFQTGDAIKNDKGVTVGNRQVYYFPDDFSFVGSYSGTWLEQNLGGNPKGSQYANPGEYLYDSTDPSGWQTLEELSKQMHATRAIISKNDITDGAGNVIIPKGRTFTVVSPVKMKGVSDKELLEEFIKQVKSGVSTNGKFKNLKLSFYFLEHPTVTLEQFFHNMLQMAKSDNEKNIDFRMGNALTQLRLAQAILEMDPDPVKSNYGSDSKATRKLVTTNDSGDMKTYNIPIAAYVRMRLEFFKAFLDKVDGLGPSELMEIIRGEDSSFEELLKLFDQVANEINKNMFDFEVEKSDGSKEVVNLLPHFKSYLLGGESGKGSIARYIRTNLRWLVFMSEETIQGEASSERTSDGTIRFIPNSEDADKDAFDKKIKDRIAALHQHLRDSYGKFEGIYVNARLGEAVGKDEEDFFFVQQENGQLSRVKETDEDENKTILYGPLRIPGKVNTGIVDINLFEILAKFAEYSDDFNHDGRKTDGARYGKTFYPHTDPEPDYTEYNELFGKKGKTKSEEVEQLERVYDGFDGILSITSDLSLDIRRLADYGYLCLFDDDGKLIGLLKTDGYSYSGKRNVYEKDGREYLLEDVTSNTPFREIPASSSTSESVATPVPVASEKVIPARDEATVTNPTSVVSVDGTKDISGGSVAQSTMGEVHRTKYLNITPINDSGKPDAASYSSDIVDRLKDDIKSGRLRAKNEKDLILSLMSPGTLLRMGTENIAIVFKRLIKEDDAIGAIIKVALKEGLNVADGMLPDNIRIPGQLALFYHLVYETDVLGSAIDSVLTCRIGI